MPVMDGYEASRIITAMKEKKEIADTPIIALTANAMKGDKEKCLIAGMNDYLTKPIRKKNLIDMISSWISPSALSESGDRTLEQQTGPAGADGEAEPLDLEAIKNAEASMKGKFAKLVGCYLEETAGSQLVGALQVAEIARQLEKASMDITGGKETDVKLEDLTAALRQAVSLTPLIAAFHQGRRSLTRYSGSPASFISPPPHQLRRSYDPVRLQPGPPPSYQRSLIMIVVLRSNATS